MPYEDQNNGYQAFSHEPGPQAPQGGYQQSQQEPLQAWEQRPPQVQDQYRRENPFGHYPNWATSQHPQEQAKSYPEYNHSQTNSSPYQGQGSGYTDSPYNRNYQHGMPSFQEQPAPQPKSKRLGLKIAALVMACVLGGAAIGGFFVNRYLVNRTQMGPTNAVSSLESPTSLEKAAPATQPSSAKPITNSDGSMATPDIVEMAAPATVAIFTDITAQMYGQTFEVTGSGSGVIISEDGYIVTNNHVVGGSKNIKVSLADGSEYDAQLVGINEITDVAVIKIAADKSLPFLKFANSSDLRVGETVIAIGNPLGQLQGTVSQGIVSSLHRDVTIEGQKMNDLIQMDVAINSGNSGGALLNTRGELVGINVAKTDGSNVEGIAFAIPADTVYESVNDILNGNSTLRPIIGIMGSSVTEAMQEGYDLPAGVMVERVSEGSPAEQAQLQAQDIITAIDGTKVESISDLNAVKDSKKVGDEVLLSVYRNGENLEIALTLGSN